LNAGRILVVGGTWLKTMVQGFLFAGVDRISAIRTDAFDSSGVSARETQIRAAKLAGRIGPAASFARRLLCH
jgi:hypothetical protein